MVDAKEVIPHNVLSGLLCRSSYTDNICRMYWLFVLVFTDMCLHVFFCLFSITLLSSSTRRRLYPQRSSGQAVVTGGVTSPRYVPSIFIAHRVQDSHCSSIFIECCYLTHALALSAIITSQIYARKSPYEPVRIHVHSVRIELTKNNLPSRRGRRRTHWKRERYQVLSIEGRSDGTKRESKIRFKHDFGELRTYVRLYDREWAGKKSVCTSYWSIW